MRKTIDHPEGHLRPPPGERSGAALQGLREPGSHAARRFDLVPKIVLLEAGAMQNQPTFVLVHGAFANSFSFAPLQAELALLGHRSVAVDLPGHGFGATYVRSYQAPQDLHPFDVRTLEGSHLKWLTDPAPAARVLAELAELMVKGARRG